MPQDFLDEMIAARSVTSPGFQDRVDAIARGRKLVRELTSLRQGLGLSQTLIAARMGTSQSSLARLEAGEMDPRLSTVERYARALGLDLALVREPDSAPGGSHPSSPTRWWAREGRALRGGKSG
jgi:transcriptional regulator with XRE-family HTH domain